MSPNQRIAEHMKCYFGGKPSAPAQPMPSPPPPTNNEVAGLIKNQSRGKTGRASTILSTPGSMIKAPGDSKKSILGG